MRAFIALCVAVVILGGAARAEAQSRSGASGSGSTGRQDESGYVEGFGQASFGSVTSQSFGAEAGYNFRPRIRLFGEFTFVNDTAPVDLGNAAQMIAGYLTQIQSAAVSYSVRQPIWSIQGGVRYLFPYDDAIEPYLLAAFGLARVKRDVSFTVGGTDVTDTIGSYGVVLGNDLSGTLSRPLLTVGGGMVWHFHGSVFADLQYRYGRVFDVGEGFNVNRVGAGIGVRF